MEASNRRGYNKGLFVSEEREKKKKNRCQRHWGGRGFVFIIFANAIS